MSRWASFLGAKKCWVPSASLSRVAGEDSGGIVGEPIFAAARRATSLAGMGIYDFLAGTVAVAL
jgi:hypothetical protein